MSDSSPEKINIFEYDDYRRYLRDLYQFLKSTKPNFSYRFFSRMAGFTSPNFLQLIIENKRNLSGESVDKFAKALKLAREETKFFRTLVALNQAQTGEERVFHAEQLLRLRPYRKVNPLKEAQHYYYSHWYLVPIRELVGLEGFREDPQWISRQLEPSISVGDAKKALETLETLQLVRRDARGKLVQSDALVSTGDQVASALVAQFHREMIEKGRESLDRFGAADRQISSVTLGLSPAGMKKIRVLIDRFRKELMEVARRDVHPTRVAQFNFQLFPLTQEIED